MVQHKAFSLALFLSYMVLFVALFGFPFLLMHTAHLKFVEQYKSVIVVIVLVPSFFLSHWLAKRKETDPNQDSVTIENGIITVGVGLLSMGSPRPGTRDRYGKIRISCDDVCRIELIRRRGGNRIRAYYELRISSDAKNISIPLNDWVVRSLRLVELDSQGREVSEERGNYPGYGFVSEVYGLLSDVPWKVSDYYSGKYETHKNKYKFDGIEQPWSKDRIIKSPAKNPLRMIAATIAITLTILLMVSVGYFYIKQKRQVHEQEKAKAVQLYKSKKLRSKGIQ